jgi:hypothetical protein
MDPKAGAAIVPGIAVRILPAARAQQIWSVAHVVSVRENGNQRVYVLYDNDTDRFFEMSGDATKMRPGLPQRYRSFWMGVYVTTLDVGSEEIQQMVEAILRSTEGDNPNNIAEMVTDYETPMMHIAASEGKYNAVQWLLAKGADVNALDKFGYTGYTALHDAWISNRLSVCKLLLEKGADPNIRTDSRHKMDDAMKILLLYGGGHEHFRVLLYKRTASILVRALCSGASPISRLPADILRTYLLPLILDAE